MSKGPTKQMRRRLFTAAIIITLCGFCVLIFRLGTIQIVDSEFYQQKARAQQLRDESITPLRGYIYDANKNILAMSATVWTVYLAPVHIDKDNEAKMAQVAEAAEYIAPILGIEEKTILERAKKSTYYEILKRKVEKETVEQIMDYASEHSINWIGFTEDSQRYYPGNELASNVIGFTGTENYGLYGLEAYYDEVLTGTAGRIVSAKNAIGTDMPFEYEIMYEAKQGNSIVSTIDQTVQRVVENHLETAVKENHVANRAVCIVMNVKTGAILAMATKGDYNLNSPWEIQDAAAKELLATLSGDAHNAELYKLQLAQWRNKAISDPYEPGSVFKILTGAMGLEEGITRVDESYKCTGRFTVPGTDVVIKCHQTYGHGTLTLTGAYMKSCNPWFMKIGTSLGVETFFRYFKAFGLTERSGIDLLGEASGIYFDPNSASGMTIVNVASNSIGQTFKVTPLNFITALSAAVNGGYLLEPRLVSQVIDSDGNIVQSFDREVVRQVISESTSAELCQMLEQSVLGGGGKYAYVPGYRIGGKTGTAQKLDKYDENGERTGDIIPSFFAVTPTDDPEIAVLLMLDEPQEKTVYGSGVAAPVVGLILSEILPHLGFAPEYTEAEMAKLEVTVSNVTGQSIIDAQSKLSRNGLSSKVLGNGTTVIKQIPEGGKTIPKDGTVILYTDQSSAAQTVTVPNTIGKTAQVASKMLTNAGLNIKIEKSGQDLTDSVVGVQSIPAGQQVPRGTVVTLQFVQKDADELL